MDAKSTNIVLILKRFLFERIDCGIREHWTNTTFNLLHYHDYFSKIQNYENYAYQISNKRVCKVLFKRLKTLTKEKYPYVKMKMGIFCYDWKIEFLPHFESEFNDKFLKDINDYDESVFFARKMQKKPSFWSKIKKAWGIE